MRWPLRYWLRLVADATPNPCGLTLPSRGQLPAGFARFQLSLISNVGPAGMSHQGPIPGADMTGQRVDALVLKIAVEASPSRPRDQTASAGLRPNQGRAASS